jgi:hypothetical protein
MGNELIAYRHGALFAGECLLEKTGLMLLRKTDLERHETRIRSIGFKIDRLNLWLSSHERISFMTSPKAALGFSMLTLSRELHAILALSSGRQAGARGSLSRRHAIM